MRDDERERGLVRRPARCGTASPSPSRSRSARRRSTRRGSRHGRRRREGRRRAGRAPARAHESGSTEKPKSATSSETAPSAPGRMTPGWKISNPIPAMPARKSSETMFGSISVERNRVTKPGFDVVDLRAGRVQGERAVTGGACASPSTLVEQRRQRGRDQVDHVQPQRLGRGQVRRLADGRVGPRDVAPVALREAAERRGRVVHHLSPQVAADVRAARVDRGRRADVRLRRHREHVGRLGDPDAGRGGAGAVRRDVDDHRDLRPRAPSARSCASSRRARRACRGRSRPRRSDRRPPGRAGC